MSPVTTLYLNVVRTDHNLCPPPPLATTTLKKKQNSADAVAVAVELTMAPRQLIMPPKEDDLNPEPGSKRVRPSRADKSSTQVRLRARASACGTPWPGHAQSMACTAGTCLGKWPEPAALDKGRHPPLLPQLRLSTTILSGGSNRPQSNSLLSNGPFQKNLEPPTPRALTTTSICIHQIVPVHADPLAPTAAELAGEEPPSETDILTERQVRTRF
eukprot:scaffold360_cov128-Isochrysis_galbana.AAC.2